MAAVATQSDALRLLILGVEILHLHAVGTVAGVQVLAAAARNGPGSGVLRTDGASLSWRAPGASAFGPPVAVASDGSVLLLAADPESWLRVQVHASFLAGAEEAAVLLADRFGNGVVFGDVTAAGAAAGDVRTYELVMQNDSQMTLSGVRVWLDAAASGLEISDDASTWVTPTTEAAALAFPDLAPAGTDSLWVRRTTAAGASSNPKILDHLHFAWCSI